MTRERVSHVFRPLAQALGVAVVAVVLYYSLEREGGRPSLLPIQVPLFALTWARAVAMVQAIKVRFGVM